MSKLDEYLQITEAAEYLGVSRNTLRNWGWKAKIVERRHPVNGYRLYAKDELDLLLREAEKTRNSGPPSGKPK